MREGKEERRTAFAIHTALQLALDYCQAYQPTAPTGDDAAAIRESGRIIQSCICDGHTSIPFFTGALEMTIKEMPDYFPSLVDFSVLQGFGATWMMSGNTQQPFLDEVDVSPNFAQGESVSSSRALSPTVQVVWLYRAPIPNEHVAEARKRWAQEFTQDRAFDNMWQ